MNLTAIYNELNSALLGYIKSNVANTEDAEDILQNVYLKIATNIDQVSAKEKLKSWIYTVTRNSITDYYRIKSKKKTILLEDDITENTPETEDPDNTGGLDSCLQGFIDQLPEDYRKVMVDVELRGHRQKDLVGKYNMAYPTIRSRVQRGREKLKSMLLNCCSIQWDTRGNIVDVVSKGAGCATEIPGRSCN